MNHPRTVDSICLLCCKEKATKTNSHLIPAGILKQGIGKRNKEDAFVIRTDNPSIEEFRGRDFGESATSNQNSYTRDFYFCPKCEELLGKKLEGIVIPHLDKLKDEKYKSNFETINSGDIQVKRFKNLDSNVFNVFFLSVIWRMSLREIFEVGKNPLIDFGGQEMEQMRRVLYSFLYKDLEYYDKFKDQFGFYCFTYKEIADPSANLSLVVNWTDTPNVFLIHGYILFLFCSHDFDRARNEKKALKIDVDKINYPTITPRIGVLGESTWMQMLIDVLGFTSEIFCKSLANEVLKVHPNLGNTDNALSLIYQIATSTYSTLDFSEACVKATELLVGAELVTTQPK